jgi:hypothetical protein
MAVAQRERQYDVRRSEDGEETTEPIAATGQRWNGNKYADAKEVLDEANMRCDRPLVAHLMVEIAEKQILHEERIEMYASMTPEELEADKHEVHHPFIDYGDERTSVGLSYVNGKLTDALPTEEIYTAEESEEDEQ